LAQGFFIYASIFALISSMVTSRAGRRAIFVSAVMLLLVSFISAAVIRDPGRRFRSGFPSRRPSTPITMPVGYWRKRLSKSRSILINAAAI